jgi:hypothetical protein
MVVHGSTIEAGVNPSIYNFNNLTNAINNCYLQKVKG